MNIPTREELANYRVEIVPGGITHPVLGAIPEKGCFPLPMTQAGTITTDNSGSTLGVIVLGIGTKFITGGVGEVVEQGDFLANPDGVIRRIKWVISDTQLELITKFPSSLSGYAVKRVKKNFYRFITAESTGTEDAILDEQSFPVGAHWLDDGAPVSYDVSASDSAISFTLSI